MKHGLLLSVHTATPQFGVMVIVRPYVPGMGGTMPSLEEGDKCPHCDGKMGLEPVQGCTCHIWPPCSQCVDNPLVCLKCGFNPEEDE